MTPDQARSLESEYDLIVIVPDWVVNVPAHLRVPRNHAFAVRCALPKVIPGYDVYFWFDSDGWVQTDEFFEGYLKVARRGELAIVREEEPVYPFDWKIAKWDLGNQIRCSGLLRGLQVYRTPFINAGFYAARNTSPLWSRWQCRYEAGVQRSGKIVLDQHSLKAAIALDKVAVGYLGGTYNWICSRARPLFDTDRGLFCVPYHPFEPIAIMHLAGTSKQVEYEVDCLGGGKLRKTLLFAK
jgi:hypothetical protein